MLTPGAYTADVCRKSFAKPSDAIIRNDAPILGDEDWTIKLWFRPESTPKTRHQAIVQKGSPSGNNQFDWRIYWMDTADKPPQHIGFDYRSSGGNGGFESTSSQLIKVKQWNHLMASKKDKKIHFYLNGQRIKEMNVGKENTDNFKTLSIGRGNVGGAGQTFLTDAFICDLSIRVGVAEQTGAKFDLPAPCQCKGVCLCAWLSNCVCAFMLVQIEYTRSCVG